MSTKTTIAIDKSLQKKAAAQALKDWIPLSAVVSLMLRDYVSGYKQIRIVDEPQLKPEVIASLQQAREEARQGINVSPQFDSTQDALDRLHCDDHQFS